MKIFTKHKNSALSTRSFLMQSISTFVIACLSIYLYFISAHPEHDVPLFVPASSLLFLSALIVIYYLYIFIPFHKINKLDSLFLEGIIFEDFFKQEFLLTTKTAAVHERFHNLVNSHDAINLTIKQAEYLALQNQINPHFLYNTLEAIRSDAICAGLDDIAKSSEALASFFRYTITEVNSLVPLANEIDNVENYFFIQQYRFGKKIKMNVICPDPNDLLLLLPKLTLQPIVENSIIHGLEGKAAGGTVLIRIESSEKNLFISIEDDGVGMSPDVLAAISQSLEQGSVSHIQSSTKRGSGIALMNVSRRIKLLFGDEYGVHIFSTPIVGTSVHITLPRVKSDSIDSVKVHA